MTRHLQETSDFEYQMWHKLPWNMYKRQVLRMQKHIYRASQRGDTLAVYSQQQLLLESEAARLLVVRHVTEESEGRDTAGVDGIKSVPPGGRLALASAIHPDHWHQVPPKPVLRVWIPKPGTAERRPLAILSMIDRCKQTLAKMALEPEWEARFEPHSYGYRPGRGTHDAIAAIVQTINLHSYYAFVTDIEGAFDHINQDVLLDKLQTYPALREALHAWFMAGIIDKGVHLPSEIGIPQGSSLSPLLLNIALHGMETIVKDSNADVSAGEPSMESPLVIRYADDFLILHSKLEELQKAVNRVTVWLQQMGLSLNPRKTYITHTLSSYQGRLGFDFLGFSIRQYPPEKTEAGPLSMCKTVIIPSAEASHHHLAIIAERLEQLRVASQSEVISELNPIIDGWATYYDSFVSAHSLSRYDELVGHLLLDWAKRHHPNKDSQEVISRYWHPVDEGEWVFSTPDGIELRSHCQTRTQEPTNPYDEDSGSKR